MRPQTSLSCSETLEVGAGKSVPERVLHPAFCLHVVQA
jgi:hypothetical protein